MWTPYRGNYAYGWSVSNDQPARIICHGGGINGFSSYILRIPDSDLCVVVLSNQSNSDTADIARALAKLVRGEDVKLPRITSIVDSLD